MHPILIEVGGFELHTYGAMGALGFVYVAAIALQDARRHGWSHDRMVDVIFYTSLVAILGARVVFFLQNPGVVPWSQILSLRTGGMVFYGGPLVGLPVGIWLVRRYGLPLWEVLDTFGRTLPVAHGLARLGCFGAGCCYGSPTDLPWAVHYTHPTGGAPVGVGVHPTQLYEAIGLFGIGLGLAWLEGRKRYAGQVMLTYLGAYAVLRVIVEVFRGDADRRFVPVLGLSTSQAISLVVLVLVAWVSWYRRREVVAG
jgi:phosphatidylglycerol:prolipoprotein diacylglycerol transferase